MVSGNTGRRSILLGSTHYPISGAVKRGRIDRFVDAFRTGPREYRNESVLDQWIISNLRGGVGHDELGQAVDSPQTWWTNCNVDYEGHMTLGRKAVALTMPTLISWTDTDLEVWTDASTLTNWTQVDEVSAGTVTRTGGGLQHQGTYCAELQPGATANSKVYVYQTAANWSTDYQGATVSIQWWVWATNASSGRIAINDGVGRTYSAYHTGGGSWELLSVSRKLDAAATGVTIELWSDLVGLAARFDDGSSLPALSGSLGPQENFNDKLYRAYGPTLLELDSAGAKWNFKFNAPAGDTITALKSSLNSCLYLGQGDTTSYYYMTTSDVFASSNKPAYWMEENGGKFFRFLTDGTCESATDPNSATPTYIDEGSLTSAPTLREPKVYMDASGNDILYWPTKGTLYAHDDTDNLWLATKVRLGDHPNGGLGAVFWSNAFYQSAGLAVRAYDIIKGNIDEVGLDREGGIPVEYNGEITYLADGGENDLFALVDASQTSGNSKSGLWAYNGVWRCFWVDTSNNGAMYHCIVSSAASSHRVYWDCGGTTYYIDLPRGVRNPKKLTTETYAASSVWIGGNNAHGAAGFNKTVRRLTSYFQDLTANETATIKYRKDKSNTDLDTGWTTLVTLDTTGENGKVETDYASQAGIEYNYWQYRVDLARGGTDTLSPDMQGMTHSFRRLGYHNTFTVEIVCGNAAQTAKAVYDQIISDAGSATFLEFTFQDSDADASETYYVFVHPASVQALQTPGRYEANFSLTLVEP